MHVLLDAGHGGMVNGNYVTPGKRSPKWNDLPQLFEGVRFINLLKEGKETLNTEDLKSFGKVMNAFVFDVLGLEDEKVSNSNNDKLEGTVTMLIEMRKQARENKNFALSDQIRDQLIALGIQLKDGKEGTTFSVQ